MSLHNISPLLTRKHPNQLDELRLENCKISKEILLELLQTLNERCYLSKLGLVNVNLTEESFYELCELVEYSGFLEELDIRWAGIRPSVMSYLIEILRTNKRLKVLNLA